MEISKKRFAWITATIATMMVVICELVANLVTVVP